MTKNKRKNKRGIDPNAVEERRCYGYFKCTQCQHVWESSKVYCESGNLETALYSQDCSRCKISNKPYRILPLRCPICLDSACSCKRKYWHYFCEECQVDFKIFKKFKKQRNRKCRECKTECQPIACPVCLVVVCVCESGGNARNTNIAKPHRADLCGRCKIGRKCGQA